MPDQKELRVFISSTFRDLTEERDHLHTKVLPDVHKRCDELGVTFTQLGFRAAAEDATSAMVRNSLEEIDRARPYFLGITGSLYGLVPQTTDLLNDEVLTAQFPWIEQAIREGASITDLEFRHGALNANGTTDTHARFYFRQRLYGRDAASNDRMKLIALENRVRNRGFTVRDYREAETLGEHIRTDLLEILERDFGE